MLVKASPCFHCLARTDGVLQALTVSCGLWCRYRLSGRRRHLEGPLRPVQEAQKEIGGEPRETPPAITQEELTTARTTDQHF